MTRTCVMAVCIMYAESLPLDNGSACHCCTTHRYASMCTALHHATGAAFLGDSGC